MTEHEEEIRMSDKPNSHRGPDPDGALETPDGFVVFGRQLSRRDLMRLGGGMAGLAAVQALLAACGGGSSNNSTAAATSGTSGAATSAPTSSGGAAGGSPAAAGSPSAGAAKTTGTLVNGGGSPPSSPTGELKVAIVADPTSLDPVDTYSLNNGRWQENIFSPLVWRDPNLVVYDGKDGHPSPAEGFGLAESWNYTDDKTLEMKLLKGVTFQDGTAFNGAAVKSTFDRLLDPANKSPQAFNYTSIDSVEVVDDQTVKFHFKEVDPVMVTKLAGYGAFITPPSATKDDTTFSTKQAIGSGPYKITEYAKDDHMTFEAWDGYFAKKKPLIQKITYRIIPDDNTRLSEFMAGNIDVLTLNVSQAGAAKGNTSVKVVEVGVPTVSGLRLDTKKAPTDNKQVRQAIAYAVDINTIVKTILGGFAKPVGIWQSPFSFGYEDYPPYPFDPDKAKQTLQASGVSSPKLVYDVVGSDTQAKEIASAVKDMLTAVGFQVDIQLHDQATYFTDYTAGKLNNIVPFGWGGWTLDYDNTYYSMYYTKQSYNPSYSNPDLDKLLDKERGTLDQSVRLDVAKQCNKIIYDDYVDVALYQNVYLWGVNNRVKNFLIPPDERLWWLDAWVSS
ncbi:MAG TPA: ABC transporter substrate-binding protein [Thermomicrobiaceae bacterium]|nr:ABC transporter substrate-binding protein [Thermomicrobiaceae bacterium]